MCGPPPMIKFACLPNLEKVRWLIWCRGGTCSSRMRKKKASSSWRKAVELKESRQSLCTDENECGHPLCCDLIVAGVFPDPRRVHVPPVACEHQISIFFPCYKLSSPISLFHVHGDLFVCPFSLFSLCLFSRVHLSLGSFARPRSLYISRSLLVFSPPLVPYSPLLLSRNHTLNSFACPPVLLLSRLATSPRPCLSFKLHLQRLGS